MLPHRAMLFSFLGDASLSRAQRLIGVVLILRSNAYRKYRSSGRPINWDKLALLSGYGPEYVKRIFNELAECGWLALRADGDGYEIVPARIEAAIVKQAEHFQKIKEDRAEKKRADRQSREDANQITQQSSPV